MQFPLSPPSPLPSDPSNPTCSICSNSCSFYVAYLLCCSILFYLFLLSTRCYPPLSPRFLAVEVFESREERFNKNLRRLPSSAWEQKQVTSSKGGRTEFGKSNMLLQARATTRAQNQLRKTPLSSKGGPRSSPQFARAMEAAAKIAAGMPEVDPRARMSLFSQVGVWPVLHSH
jgi:hypothetical protein